MTRCYIENPKDSNKKVLELISEFSKVAGYKINIENSFTFLYTIRGFSSGSVVKDLPAMQKVQETQVRSLGGEDPTEKSVESHSTILA